MQYGISHTSDMKDIINFYKGMDGVDYNEE